MNAAVRDLVMRRHGKRERVGGDQDGEIERGAVKVGPPANQVAAQMNERRHHQRAQRKQHQPLVDGRTTAERETESRQDAEVGEPQERR